MLAPDPSCRFDLGVTVLPAILVPAVEALAVALVTVAVQKLLNANDRSRLPHPD